MLNGTEVTFNCTTDANPGASNYKFFHNGYLLGSSSSGVYRTNITESGSYACTAINAVGSGQSSSIDIAVVGNQQFVVL